MGTTFYLLVLGFISLLGRACPQYNDNEDVYLGKFLGKFNSFHHQVGGDVYAVNQYSLHIKKFMYDGNGKDTFFWAGSGPRPGPQGFIVPNERGRTNVLGSYLNEDITITLPDGKTINEIRWFSVYDLTRHEPFGDLYIPEGFEPPRMLRLNRLTGKTGHVNSDPIIILDSKTLKIDNFEYDGEGQEVYFWVGVGPQPHSRGDKIPDELGYLTPLGRYHRASIVLTLPGDLSVQTVNWLAVYDVKTSEVLGSVILHDDLNVPPSLVHITPHSNTMPQCEQLHRDLQLSWSVFGDQVTIEVAVRMGLDEYVAFGMSGSAEIPKMIGGDAVMLHRDTYLPYANDINMTSYFPCTELLKQKKGVCLDEEVGGIQDYQIMSSTREDGVSIFTYRRRLITADSGDIPYIAKGPAMIIWAIGRLDEDRKPTMHHAWSKVAQPLDFGRLSSKNCFSFTHDLNKKISPWEGVMLTDPNTEEFTARLGPDGGPRGYSAITGNPAVTGKSWYINGFLAPEVFLRRNRKYKFQVEGGASPHDPANYHPLIITDEPFGGFSQLTGAQQAKVRVLAGVDYTQRGDVRPMRGGRLCEWRHPSNVDRRRDADVPTFPEYRNALDLQCDKEGDPRTLNVFPNKSWPAIVYYNSWTGFNMGWKIHILDAEERVVAAPLVSSAPQAGQGSSLVAIAVGLWLAIVM